LRFGADATPITLDSFKSQLQSLASKNPELKLAISADKAAPWGQIVRVMDVAKESNIKVANAFMKEASKP
jgi:biopolymer transport protein ExbD